MPDRIENGIAYLNGLKVGDIYGSNYISISNAGVVTFAGTASIGAVSLGATTITGGLTLGNATIGINLSGVYTTAISGNSMTITPDATRTKSFISFGNRTTQKTIDLGATAGLAFNCDPIQVSIKITDTGGLLDTDSTVNLTYMLLTHEESNKANLRLKCSDWNIVVKKNVKDVYCGQFEVDFATNALAVGGEAAIIGATMDCSSAVTGNVYGAVIAMTGTGTPATTSACLFLSPRTSGMTVTHGIYLEPASGVTLTNAIYVNNVGTLTNFIQATTENGAIGATRATPNQNATCDGSLKVLIGAKTLYIPLYSAVTVA